MDGSYYTRGLYKDSIYTNEYANLKISIPDGLSKEASEDYTMSTPDYMTDADQKRIEATLWDADFMKDFGKPGDTDYISIGFLNTELGMNRLSRFEKALNKNELLIIDELSYLTFNRYQSEMLFQVISERSERSSVIITTNLEFSEWTQLFDNEMMLAALIDRVTFRSFVLNMNCSSSYRFDATITS